MATIGKKKNILVWVLVAAGLGTAAFILIKRLKDAREAEGKLGMDGSGNQSQSNCNDNFPLKKGSCGKRVENVQKILNIAPTGNFDQFTQDSLEAALNVKQVSKTLYKQYEDWMISLGMQTYL